MSFPKPPGVEETKKITSDDVATILNVELHPVHRDDPTVLKFINAYLMTRDLGEAGKAAGIDKRSARTLRNRRDIHTAIQKVTDAAVLKYGLDANEIVEKVKDIAFFDPADLFTDDGRVKHNIHEIPASARRAIKTIKHKTLYENDINGMKTEVGYITEFSFWDKTKSLEFLGREKSLFKERVVKEHDVTDNMKEVLLGSQDRAAERMRRLRESKEIREVKDVGSGSKALPESPAGPQKYWAGDNRGDTIETQGRKVSSNEVRVGRPGGVGDPETSGESK